MSDGKKPQLDSDYAEISVDDPNAEEVLRNRAEALIQAELRKTNPIAVASSNSTPPGMDPDTVRKERQDAISQDALLKQIREGSNSFALLDSVIEEIAIEVASMKFERGLNERRMQDTTKTSKGRAQILKMIGDLLVTKKELARQNVINLRSKKMQSVFKFLIGVVRETIETTPEIQPEQRELFFANLQKALIDFEDRAEDIMSKIEDE
jgi:hypothetical protein